MSVPRDLIVCELDLLQQDGECNECTHFRTFHHYSEIADINQCRVPGCSCEGDIEDDEDDE